jgi:spermidine synthase
MVRPLHRIAALLFCSGACALLYQIVWLRELRLIFGASTSASAAVLAMFMGGLGAGGLVLGKRVDRRKDPLMMYANLELGVAVLAAATPFLVDGSRLLYSALGGTVSMGMGLGTVVRILLSAVVLVPVTFLMGGTLPAAAKAAETDDDLGRKHLALLYGLNTLGAVTGSLFTTFVLLEVFGGRLLLWMCCLLNALLGVIARGVARGLAPEPAPSAMKSRPGDAAAEDDADREAAGSGEEAESSAQEGPASEGDAPASGPKEAVPALFVLVAAAVVGLTFLLMELVFYRMLGPILGGSSYTFGLILVFALLGVGLGGAAYARYWGNRPATLRAFALTCLLEALCFLIPFALGDRVALIALALRSFKALGFYAPASGASRRCSSSRLAFSRPPCRCAPRRSGSRLSYCTRPRPRRACSSSAPWGRQRHSGTAPSDQAAPIT